MIGGVYALMQRPVRKPKCWSTGQQFLFALLLALLTLGTPATARAHGSLKSSAPAAGQLLYEVPRQLRLLFTADDEAFLFKN